jgi:TRAP-type mannitol/chloroaromatic compound transport system permease small subunit
VKTKVKFLNSYVKFVDKLNATIGKQTSWLTLALVLVVVFDVVIRYVFNESSVAMQELEWHLFAILFLMGTAYTLQKDDHVRVDLFYSKFNVRQKAWLNIAGTIIFLIPFSLLIIYASQNYVLNSFAMKDSSPDPGGLPARYILKAFIPLSFLFLLLQGVSLLFKSIIDIKNFNVKAD